MVKIITDSTCDLTKERMDEIDVICVPLTVHIGNDIYLDGVNLGKTEFYEKLRTEKSFPTTAQPTPHTFEEVFTAALKEADEVVCLLISSELSGTAQSANIAKNTMERDEIYILDSRTTCLSLGLLVEIAAQRAKEGKTAAQIMAELEGLTSRVRICAGIETLEYLKKGGRLSGTAAALGTMLNIRPLMGILDGKVLMLGKARGNKKMYAQLKQMVEEEGIDDAYPVLLGHAQSMENYEKFKEVCGDLIAGRAQLYGDIGCVVGAHAGPGIVGIAFIKKA